MIAMTRQLGARIQTLVAVQKVSIRLGNFYVQTAGSRACLTQNVTVLAALIGVAIVEKERSLPC
jgi:hypothetical protein